MINRTVVVLAWLGFCAASVQAAEVLDQSTIGPSIGVALINEGFLYGGQSFTAGKSGELTRAVAVFGRSPQRQVDFDFSVWRTANGVPVGNALTSKVVPWQQVPDTLSVFSDNLRTNIVFAQPAAVVAGQQYALLVRGVGVSNGPGQAIGIWVIRNNVYSGGSELVGQSPTLMQPESVFDNMFETYVVVPEPAGAAFLLAAGIFGRRRV